MEREKKSWRANETHTTQMSSEEEVVDEGLEKKKSRPKWKRWKSQARDTNKKPSKAGTVVSKRLCSEVMWASPKKKKAKPASPAKEVLVGSPTEPLSETLKLSWEVTTMELMEVPEPVMEELSAEAGGQPRRKQ